jgi:hypothetical protein
MDVATLPRNSTLFLASRDWKMVLELDKSKVAKYPPSCGEDRKTSAKKKKRKKEKQKSPGGIFGS